MFIEYKQWQTCVLCITEHWLILTLCGYVPAVSSVFVADTEHSCSRGFFCILCGFLHQACLTSTLQMCHLLIFQACCLSPAHFQFSIYLLNCGTAGASKPSIPSLVESIVRQQDLRCPFLVISWGNECYHNPPSWFCFLTSLCSPSAICKASL